MRWIGFLLMSGWFLGGCATGVLIGAGQGGYEQPAGGRSQAQIRSDAEITAAVNRALVADRVVPVMAIEVSTLYGNVTLQGRVPDQSTASRAVAVTKWVSGVRAVVSRLTVSR